MCSIFTVPMVFYASLLVLVVFGSVYDASLCQCLSALAAGAASAAMLVASLVTAPRLGVVYAQLFAMAGYVGLRYGGVGGEDFFACEGAGGDRETHLLTPVNPKSPIAASSFK